jgi:hypothetical protein
MNPAFYILQTLAKHLEGPVHIRLLGGAALILGYGLDRATEDADLLAEDAEIQQWIDVANFGQALELTNRELEPFGLYLTHIWGPEQQILTPEWRMSCRSILRDWGNDKLTVSVLGPLDLILSKLCRADDADLEDIQHLIRREGITRSELESALNRAQIPPIFAEVFLENQHRIIALFF